jgi:sugar transferase (PEP-CTERM/EpsH1 system associated)
LEKGDRVRAYNQIKQLSKKHEIILCALNHKKLHPNAMDKLRPYCKSIHIYSFTKIELIINLIHGLLSHLPLQVAFFTNKKAKRFVNEVISSTNPDHIFTQLVRTAEFTRHLKDYKRTLDYQDSFSRNFEGRIEKVAWFLRPIIKREARMLIDYENEIFSSFDNKIIISELERESINHPYNFEIMIIGNGIDSHHFHPVESRPKFDLVFVGGMDYYPNIVAAKFLAAEIVPRIRKSIPGIKLLIAGAYPTREVQALESENVHIGGWYDDIRDAYSSAKVFIAPMQIGGGVQNKLLEAMSMGIPCISSPLSNSALKAEPGRDILIGYSADEYVGLAVGLLNNAEQSAAISEAGRRFVIENFSWEKSCDDLSEIFETGSVKSR